MTSQSGKSDLHRGSCRFRVLESGMYVQQPTKLRHAMLCYINKNRSLFVYRRKTVLRKRQSALRPPRKTARRVPPKSRSPQRCHHLSIASPPRSPLNGPHVLLPLPMPMAPMLLLLDQTLLLQEFLPKPTKVSRPERLPLTEQQQSPSTWVGQAT